MRIGLDVAQTCSERAGCAWYADSLARALAHVGSEHEFFLYHQFGDWINPTTDRGTHIIAPNVTPTFTDVTPEEASRIWLSPTELVIKTGAPDIVHANSFRAPRVPGAKLVFTVYDVSFWAVPHFTTEQNRLSCQRGLLAALRSADGFIFISKNAHAEFERFLPGWLDESNCPWCVTPLAARTPATARPLEASRGKYWLSVGSLEPRKNHGGLLDAFQHYWEKSPQRHPLWVAGGSGWNSAEIARRLETLAEKGMVRRLGYVPDEELESLYRDAFALVFPSWYEGFGLPVLEAMTLGCPVICSRGTSMDELGGAAVVYIDPADTHSITNAMLRLEDDPTERETRRSVGLAKAATFSWEVTAQNTLNFYSKVLKHRRAHDPTTRPT